VGLVVRLAFRRWLGTVDKALASRAADGPYRFLVRRWTRINDIDLAVQVLNTEFFRGEMQSVELPIERIRSILMLAPHQDDECIGAGGTLVRAARAGARVDILYLTDGAQQGKRSSEESVTVRRAEAQEVCRRIGAQMHELGLPNARPAPTRDHVRRLAELIRELRPEVIIAPWLLDLPAKHRMPNHLLWLADQAFGLPECEFWGCQIHNTLVPNGYVDITSVAEEKRELLRCFRSQIEERKPYDHLAMGMAAWNSRFLPPASTPRYAEVFFTLPKGEFMQLLERFYFLNLDMTYQGDPQVIPGMDAIHRQIVRSGRSANGSAVL
jgi:LmbE family N-acetylglucosaminyl deacetylase